MREALKYLQAGAIVPVDMETTTLLVNALKEALAQPAQEPVAWLEPEWGEKICPEVGYEVTMTDDHPRDLGWIPLYAQRTWVELTDAEFQLIYDMGRTPAGMMEMVSTMLKEKNNG